MTSDHRELRWQAYRELRAEDVERGDTANVIALDHIMRKEIHRREVAAKAIRNRAAMIAFFMLAALHDLTPREIYRACGPEGTVFITERKVRGHWREIPICSRPGWNGRRYIKRDS